MAKFRIDSIAGLARQLGFAPADVRLVQLNRAEELLHLIEPNKAYPLDFVIFKITEYRSKEDHSALLAGVALQHDLGLLIEQVSDSLNLATSSFAEPVLDIDDVCSRFNVTSKTIQRWRRRGLPARRFVFPDGKRRVGFLLGSVERFVSNHQQQVVAAGNFSQVGDTERDEILRRGRRLASMCHCCVGEITRRIARRLDRSPLTILHTIRKHDQEHPDGAIFPQAAEPICEADRTTILKGQKRGTTIKALARRLCRPRSAIYRVLLDARAQRINARKVRFFDDPLFHGDEAETTINHLLSQEELAEEPRREELRVPRDLPPYLQDLYRTPLLTKSKERALFLKLNFYKYQFVQARRRLDPELVRNRDLNLLERLLEKIQETKNAIIRANLRLVVSIARRHLRPGIVFAELVSDGNMSLMRAVDGFDVSRGNRFSTFATLALMKGFARSVPQMQMGRRLSTIDEQVLESVPDRRDRGADRLAERDEVRQLLGRLTERERSVVCAHFGLGSGEAQTYEQLARDLGVSKERVRQIEQGALAKLRDSIH